MEESESFYHVWAPKDLEGLDSLCKFASYEFTILRQLWGFSILSFAFFPHNSSLLHTSNQPNLQIASSTTGEIRLSACFEGLRLHSEAFRLHFWPSQPSVQLDPSKSITILNF
jgi:hypothetical protein